MMSEIAPQHVKRENKLESAIANRALIRSFVTYLLAPVTRANSCDELPSHGGRPISLMI